MKSLAHTVQLTIRPFEQSDLDGVCSIERRSFPHPWTGFEFKLSHWRNPLGFLMALRNGKVVEYVIAEAVKRLEPRTFRSRKREHLLNLAVDPSFRREGIGKALVEAITAYCGRRARKTFGWRFKPQIRQLEAFT